MIMFVVNGFPESGKTLFAKTSEEILKSKFVNLNVLKTSVVDPVKELALKNGWDGEKTPNARRLLSDIKDMLDRYCNFTQGNLEKFARSGADIVFVDAREPQDIEYAVKTFGAHSVFIDRKPTDTNFSNHADANVLDYSYEYYLDNNGTLEEFLENINLLLYNAIGMNYEGKTK